MLRDLRVAARRLLRERWSIAAAVLVAAVQITLLHLRFRAVQ